MRKALKFKKLRRTLKFKMLSLEGKGPPAFSSSVVAEQKGKSMDEASVLMAVRVTGGLGDFIVAARLVRDICAYTGNLKIHLFCPSEGIATWVFKSIPEVEAVYSDTFFHHVHSKYDCAVAVNQMAYYYGEHSNYNKIRAISPNLLKVLGSLNKSRPQWDIYIQHHPFLDGAMAHTAVALGETRNTLLHTMCGLKSTGPAFHLVVDDAISVSVRGKFDKWITVNTGFDANFAIGARTATKCYPLKHWNAVIDAVKKERPDIAVVQIGSKTGKRIAGVDVDLIGKTSLPQAASLINEGLLHLDNEGGLVHVAASMSKKAAVMFGPTSEKYFAYPDNINLASNFCGNCWWSKKTWMESCPREFDAPLCMEYLEPGIVAAAVLRELNQKSAANPGVDSRTTAVTEKLRSNVR